MAEKEGYYGHYNPTIITEESLAKMGINTKNDDGSYKTFGEVMSELEHKFLKGEVK